MEELEKSGSAILAVCGAVGLIFGLGIFVWYGMLRGFTRTALVTMLSSLMKDDASGDDVLEDEPFDPETAPEHLSDIMTEQASSLDFAEAVEKHRTQEVTAVHAESVLDDNIADKPGKGWREFSPVSRTTRMVSRPFRFIRLRLRPDETDVELSPPLREDSESDVE